MICVYGVIMSPRGISMYYSETRTIVDHLIGVKSELNRQFVAGDEENWTPRTSWKNPGLIAFFKVM